MADLWDAIVLEASAESELWREALLPSAQRELRAVFSPLGEERFALGLETIYEGYLIHYGTPRLFAPADPDTARRRTGCSAGVARGTSSCRRPIRGRAASRRRSRCGRRTASRSRTGRRSSSS